MASRFFKVLPHHTLGWILFPIHHTISFSGTQAGKEYLIHQSFIYRVDGHALVIMADMLHGIDFAIIYREGRPREFARKIRFFDFI